jgi:hypothetical protein
MKSVPAGSPALPSQFAWGQFCWITAAAIGLFIGLRLLPTGTNLNHMDFRVDARPGGAIEFCDPANPQFIPVVTMRSPVEMAVMMPAPTVANRSIAAVVRLRTASGKPIAPEDLQITHTRRLHLLIVDPALSDYQHVHPEPTRTPGEWAFAFTPRHGGVYRFFADFTPAATSRGLYASADFDLGPLAGEGERAPRPTANWVERGGIRYEITVASPPVRADRPIDLRFRVSRVGGGTVALAPVMGALAHLVAFDAARSGFAHLHPVEPMATEAASAHGVELNFKLSIPRPGEFSIWAQINLDGREEFVRFPLEVLP